MRCSSNSGSGAVRAVRRFSDPQARYQQQQQPPTQPPQPPPSHQLQFLLAVSGPSDAARIVQDAGIRAALSKFSCQLSIGGSLLRCQLGDAGAGGRGSRQSLKGQPQQVTYCCLRLTACSGADIRRCLRQLEALQPSFAGRIVLADDGVEAGSVNNVGNGVGVSSSGFPARRQRLTEADSRAKCQMAKSKLVAMVTSQHDGNALSTAPIHPLPPPSTDKFSMYFSESSGRSSDETNPEAINPDPDDDSSDKEGDDVFYGEDNGEDIKCQAAEDGRWWLRCDEAAQLQSGTRRAAGSSAAVPKCGLDGGKVASAALQRRSPDGSFCGEAKFENTPPPESPRRSHQGRTLTDCVRQKSTLYSSSGSRGGGGSGCPSNSFGDSFDRLRSLISDDEESPPVRHSGRPNSASGCRQPGTPTRISIDAALGIAGGVTGTAAEGSAQGRVASSTSTKSSMNTGAATGTTPGAKAGVNLVVPRAANRAISSDVIPGAVPATTSGVVTCAAARPAAVPPSSSSSSASSSNAASANPPLTPDAGTGALGTNSNWWWERSRRRCVTHKRILWYLPHEWLRRRSGLCRRLLAAQSSTNVSSDLIDLSSNC